jgi:transcriptional regulator with XRE-family HTH domain
MISQILYQKLTEKNFKSQSELADHIGLKPEELSRILSRQREPSREHIKLIYRAFPEKEVADALLLSSETSPEPKRELSIPTNRSTNFTHSQRSEWGKMGGRPRRQ